MFKIYTTLNGVKFYFNRDNDEFTPKQIAYEYEDDDVLLCTLIDATAKTCEMHDALVAIELGQYMLKLFIE